MYLVFVLYLFNSLFIVKIYGKTPLVNIHSIFHLNKKVMAIVTNSYLGTFTGRIGNMVIYPLAGQIVARTIGKSYKKPTNNQLNSRMALKKMNVFLQDINGFLKVGFELEAKGTTANAFNHALKYNRKHVTGTFPDVAIDYAKILVTKGNMPIVEKAKASLLTDRLKVSWDTEVIKGQTHQDDQVLLLAYFPGETGKTRIFTTSVRRSAGTYKFNLNRSATMRNAHLYLSFVSDDYKSISDSVYLGEVSWDKVAK